MAVALEFINVLVRIDAIRKKYPGGWEKFLLDYQEVIGAVGWYDEYLYREGAMSSEDISYIIDSWIENGLDVYRTVDGEPVEWLDICVTEMFGTTLKCEWFCLTEDGYGAYMKGTEPGRLVGRGSFPEFDDGKTVEEEVEDLDTDNT